MCNEPKRELRVKLVRQAQPPCVLVWPQPIGAQVVFGQRRREHIGRQRGADEAVVDAAAGRGLHEAGRIAHGQQPIGIGARDRRERKNFLTRSANAFRDETPAAPHPREQPIEVLRRGVVRHHADARADLFPANHRHDPREPFWRDLAAEVQLDVARGSRGGLNLSRVQHQPRHAEAKLPLQRIIGAARQNAGARMQFAARCIDGDAIRIDVDVRHARAAMHVDPRALRRGEQILIEDAPIDDDGFDTSWCIGDVPPGGRPEARHRQLVESRAPREREFLERAGGDDAGAMHGFTDRPVLLEQGDPETGSRQARRGVEARGTSADDDHILHRGHSNRSQNFLPRDSHVPRDVIQNDSSISRTSSHNDRRPM